MLDFSINLYTNIIKFKNIWSKDFGFITKHKCLEMQLMRNGNIFAFEFRLEWSGSSHAGPDFSIALLFHQFDITIYDHRDWNEDTNNWKTPKEAVEWKA